MPERVGVMKGRKLTGLPVVCVRDQSSEETQEIGKVREILFDPGSFRIQALLLDEGGWLSGPRVVCWEAVEEVRKTGVTVPSSAAVTTLKHEPGEQRETPERRCLQKGGLKGRRLLSADGLEIGVIEDILFEVAHGTVVGVEVSKGLIQDLLDGRSEVFFRGEPKVTDESVCLDQLNSELVSRK